MDLEVLKYIGAGLTSFGALGGAVAVGNIFAATVAGIARNPSTSNELMKTALIGAALAEGLGIISLGIGFMFTQ